MNLFDQWVLSSLLCFKQYSFVYKEAQSKYSHCYLYTIILAQKAYSYSYIKTQKINKFILM